MSEIIDLGAERNARARPDPEHIIRDDYGLEMFRFILSYEMGGKNWGGVEVWAYDADDAARRVEAMRASLKCDGQVYSVIPA